MLPSGRPLLALALVVAVIALVPAPQGAPEGTSPLDPARVPATDHADVRAVGGRLPVLPGVPVRAYVDRTWVPRVEETGVTSPAVDGIVSDAATGFRQLAGAPTGSVGSALIGGFISWADPDLGGDYLATRFPRGTLVRLCTPNRCIVRRSNDFGPSDKIDPPRIADLAVLDWESLCNLPRARGLCMGTVETVDEILLPATDAVQ